MTFLASQEVLCSTELVTLFKKDIGWVVVVILVVVVSVAVVHPFLPFGTQGIYEEPPSDSVARQPFNLDPCFATCSCFVQNGSS
jgi:hypothetical protein